MNVFNSSEVKIVDNELQYLNKTMVIHKYEITYHFGVFQCLNCTHHQAN